MSESVAAESVTLLRDNMTVHTASDALKADLAAVGKQMASEWAENVGAEGQAILEALN
jgi:hypothetical protein